MKLTKAQRLFMKAGEAQNKINFWKWADTGGDDCEYEGEISRCRKLRKKLIRAALEAWQQEEASTARRAVNEQQIY